MSEIIKYEELSNKLISINDELVLLDRDVAELYGVETKTLNQAIKRNSDKFPDDYMFMISHNELEDLRSQNVTPSLNKTRVPPKVFTEKGLYMVATILKSAKATEATFAIIETFAKIKELSRNIQALEKVKTEEEQKKIAQNVGEIFEEIIDLEPIVEEKGDEIIEVENRIELNIGFVKVSRTVKSKKSKKER